VKVSRRAHVHHVSQTQVDAPRGAHDVYFVSLWVSPDPVRGVSLTELVDALSNRVGDPPSFLKQLARTGYSPLDRETYTTRLLVLESPRWFHSKDVPRVRAYDEGVSQLRYVVTLDADACLEEAEAAALWLRVTGGAA
jgi:hypothetical protein